MGIIRYFFAGLFLFLTSCNAAKYLQGEERFYAGATIVYETPDSIDIEIPVQAELESVLTPAPNNELFGSRIGVWYRLRGEAAKKKGLKRWLGNKLGADPVFYNDNIASKLTDVLLNRMDNNGYFGARARMDTVHNLRKKEVAVTYTITVDNPAYTLKDIYYPPLDSARNSLEKNISILQERSTLWEGERYQLSQLRNEREKLDENLKNRGYYYFNPEYIHFMADSTEGDREVMLFLKLKPDIQERVFKKYRIGDIVIRPDYDIDQLNISKKHQTIQTDDFLYKGDPKNFRIPIAARGMRFSEGDYYSKLQHQATLKYFSSLGIFRYVDMSLKERPDSLLEDPSEGILDVELKMSQMTPKSFGAEIGAAQWDNGFVGPEFNTSWTHRNFLGGAEVFSVSGNVGWQKEFGSQQGAVERLLIYGLETRMRVPRIVTPIPLRLYHGNTMPATNFVVSLQQYNFKLPPESSVNSDDPRFLMTYVNTRYGFDWRSNKRSSHSLYPVAISYQIQNDPDNVLDDLIEEFPFISQTFRNQFIIGSEYAYTYNSTPGVENTNRFFFRGSIDASGNALYGVKSLIQEGEKQNELFGVPFSRYVRLGADTRYFVPLSKKGLLASRVFAGIGIPIGETEALPFSKQYFVGGANSVRAFKTRRVGPGVWTTDDVNADFALRAGDIKLEGNVEYRYDLSKYLKWAWFFDAGNIWLKNDEINIDGLPAREGTTFEFSEFYKQLAMGTGMGFRIDAIFFVLRFDMAIPLRNPAEPDPWVIKNIDFPWLADNTVFHIAIGYPF
ncbi:BamA/TamA family outer membrane protein [Algivirga pacifica]|uniref:BamA/TamA family outer membrane protein n=1 Tax=Algivirga pacifica TaxID=1162670 RepID=A0ABP9CXR7_9BACT